MNPINNTNNTAVNNSSGFDLFSNSLFFESIADFFSGIWNAYVIFAYFITIVMLFIYVYASTERRQLINLRIDNLRKKEQLFEQQYKTGSKNSRLVDIDEHIASDNPNDWKLAIIEADIVLDEELKKAGYAGVSLGERLRSISSTQMSSLDMAWQAHKVRNQIAHGGVDFILTKRLAEDTIKQYKMVFNELGIR